MTPDNRDAPRYKTVQVSTELLAELREWSEPVEVRIEGDRDGMLEMTFRRARPCPDPLAHQPREDF